MAKVRLDNLLIFTNQFASMVQSHLPLVDVLDNLSRETPDRLLRETLDEVIDNVEQGVDLGEAMAAHPNVFDDIFVNVIHAGMNSGRLGDALTQLSDYLNKLDIIRRNIRGALSYPILMVIGFVAVFNIMSFFILPRFETMFKSFNKKLPWETQLLLDFAHFWRENWLFIGGGAMVLLFLVIIWLATPQGHYLWDRWKLELPLVGRLWRMSALARFLRTLAVQVRNEVSLLMALELSASASGNVFIQDVILRIADDVERGVGLTEAFESHAVFDGIVLQMVSAGEESGNLADLLFSAADFFDRILDNQVKVMTGLINPILTVVMGLAIALMLVAAFRPVFEMGSIVSGAK